MEAGEGGLQAHLDPEEEVVNSDNLDKTASSRNGAGLERPGRQYRSSVVDSGLHRPSRTYFGPGIAMLVPKDPSDKNRPLDSSHGVNPLVLTNQCLTLQKKSSTSSPYRTCEIEQLSPLCRRHGAVTALPSPYRTYGIESMMAKASSQMTAQERKKERHLVLCQMGGERDLYGWR